MSEQTHVKVFHILVTLEESLAYAVSENMH